MFRILLILNKSPEFLKYPYFPLFYPKLSIITKKGLAHAELSQPFLGGREKQNGDVFDFEERGDFLQQLGTECYRHWDFFRRLDTYLG